MTLDRIGSNLNCVTILARYPQERDVPEITDGGDLEILFLDGTFSEGQVDHSAGTYLRVPKGTNFTVGIADTGSTLFMKSYALAKNNKQRTMIDTKKVTWRPGVAEGLQVMSLHEYEGEPIALVRLAPHTSFNLHSHHGGEEILVLEGVFYDEFDRYPTGTWIRSPHLSHHAPFTREEGALIFVKVGHLASQ